MPELPEVETITRGLQRSILGATISGVEANVACLRTPVQLEALRQACVGRSIRALRRRAKFIIVVFDNHQGLLLHLGMTGAFRVVPAATPPSPHERVIWHLDDGRHWRLIDVRRFGSVHVCSSDLAASDPPELAHLGPEPLGDRFTADYLRRMVAGRSRPIKPLIMDQRVVVGVGNIYASEALFRARIRPTRKAARMSRADCGRLVEAIRSVLSEAVAVGGTTISDYHDVDGSEGRFRTQLHVYGRHGETCPRCGDRSRVRRTVQAGRATFHCTRCQR